MLSLTALMAASLLVAVATLLLVTQVVRPQPVRLRRPPGGQRPQGHRHR